MLWPRNHLESATVLHCGEFPTGDMGLSKRRDAALSMSTLGHAVGTLGWKSPELCCMKSSAALNEVNQQDAMVSAKSTEDAVAVNGRGSEENAPRVLSQDEFALGAASDVFSSGLLLFHLLSGGRHPFDSPTQQDITFPAQLAQRGTSGDDANDGANCTLETLVRQNLVSNYTDERVVRARQERVQAWGTDWTRAGRTTTEDEVIMERARLQSDFLERLQRPTLLLPLRSVGNPEGGTSTAHADPGLAKIGGAGLRRSSMFATEPYSHSLSAEAASLVWSMLHPEPMQRPNAAAILKDAYFNLFELADEDEIPWAKLGRLEHLQSGPAKGAFGVVKRTVSECSCLAHVLATGGTS